ncbi:MAG TPA: hypothetical protein VEX38_09380 [Fimbriimonadaceae bacterium]|nr:hypothetical protein [Fimbriimonadaceae bacterium]
MVGKIKHHLKNWRDPEGIVDHQPGVADPRYPALLLSTAERCQSYSKNCGS